MDPAGHDIPNEDIAEDVRETARRGPFRFSMCGIKPGETITFVNDQTKTVRIIRYPHGDDGATINSIKQTTTQQVKHFGD